MCPPAWDRRAGERTRLINAMKAGGDGETAAPGAQRLEPVSGGAGRAICPELLVNQIKVAHAWDHLARERPRRLIMAWALPCSNLALRTLGLRSIMVRRSFTTR